MLESDAMFLSVKQDGLLFGLGWQILRTLQRFKIALKDVPLLKEAAENSNQRVYDCR